jgi:hypothetical protein
LRGRARVPLTPTSSPSPLPLSAACGWPRAHRAFRLDLFRPSPKRYGASRRFSRHADSRSLIRDGNIIGSVAFMPETGTLSHGGRPDVDEIFNIAVVEHDGKRGAVRNRRDYRPFNPELIRTCSGSSSDRHCIELGLRSNFLMGDCAEAASKILASSRGKALSCGARGSSQPSGAPTPGSVTLASACSESVRRSRDVSTTPSQLRVAHH